MGVAGIVSVSDHPGDGKPPVAHSVLPLQCLLAGKTRSHAEYAPSRQDGFLRIVVVHAGREPRGPPGPPPTRCLRARSGSSGRCPGPAACPPAARRAARSRSARLARSTHRAISSSSPAAARVSPGFSQRSTSGHIEVNCWPARRSRSTSPEMTCQRVLACSHGTASCLRSRNQPARALPVSRVDGPAGLALVQAAADCPAELFPQERAVPRCRSAGRLRMAGQRTGTGRGTSAAGPPRVRSGCGCPAGGCTSSRPWRCAR